MTAKRIIFLLAGWLGLMCLAFTPSQRILADQTVKAFTAGSPDEGLDYERCVQIALQHSPFFKESAIEIESRRLNESDSRWSLIPSLTLRTRYYLNLGGDSGNEAQVSFQTGDYNPIISYFSIQASRLITSMAVQAHLKSMAQGLHEIAVKFLELASLDYLLYYQDQLIEMARQKLNFYRELEAMEAVAPVEARIAEQELAVYASENELIGARQEALLEGLSYLLGLDDSLTRADLNVHQGELQILNDFDPDRSSWPQMRAYSFDLKIQKIKEELQNKNITLAYAQYIPNLSMGIRTPDPTVLEKEDTDYYLTLNLDVPLWKGMKRRNNVIRQKLTLKKYRLETRDKEKELAASWKEARTRLRKAVLDLSLARSAQELARLKVLRSEILYQSHDQNLAQLLESKKAHLEAKKKTLAKAREHSMAVLDLRYLSGDLFNSYINVSPWEE